MRRDGRSVAKQREFNTLLCSHHSIEVTLTLLNLNMQEVPGGDLTARLEDGQVVVDAEKAVTRALDVDLLDPTGALHLDSDSPSAGALFADRMIRVKYTTINPTGDKRYTTAVFTGPITKLERNGIVLKVECQGKEVFGLAPTWKEKTWKKGVRATTVIRVLVRDYMGENHYRIPNKKRKLPRNVSVGGDKTPWETAKRVAAMIGYHLYFDGMGVCRMRKMPSSSAFTFKDGPGGSVKTEPEVGYDINNVINAVEVWGKKPTKAQKKKGKKRSHARVVAGRSHPLSPWKLGRKGGPRYIPLIIEDDSVTSNKEAKRRARRELKRGLLESVDVAYDILTFPHLEEMDIVTVKTSKFSAKHRLKQFTVGLRSSADSSMGYVKNVKPRVSTIRPKRRTKKRRK